ncbi:MAG: glycoside hydrolase family 30 protein [Acholeplasmataceae bacterium]
MKIIGIQSLKNPRKYFEEMTIDVTSHPRDPLDYYVKVNPQITYQTHIGFGGAFTESAAYTWSHLPKDKQQQIIDAYFSPSGLGYTMGRTHINSSDFSLGHYTYVKDMDIKLQSFDISREDLYVVPMIQAAMKYVPHIKLLASPWSPPAWMKTNNKMSHGGKLKKEYQELWAIYYTKYLEQMKQRGIPFYAISVQNEPAAVQTWDSCIYTAEEERDFVKNALGPIVHTYDANLKIIGWDHNRDLIVDRAKTLLEDPLCAKHMYGIGNHWYVSEAFENLSKVKAMFPDTHLFFTEGCIEGGPKPGAWETGARYAKNLIGDLSNGVEGWIEWNLLLNEEGGPNHVGNYCDAPILANRKTHELTFNSSYYAIGHFSKFIKEGAKRIHVTHQLPKGLLTVGYQNPDGSIISILLNETYENHKISYAIEDEFVSIDVPSSSIISLITSI